MQDRSSKLNGEFEEIFAPSGHRILVLLDNVEHLTRSAGGIITSVGETTGKEQQAHDRATVIAMGPTCYNMDHHGDVPWCKVGDRVLISPHTGRSEPGNKRLKLINDEDICGVKTGGEWLTSLQDVIEKAEVAAAEYYEQTKEQQRQHLEEVNNG